MLVAFEATCTSQTLHSIKIFDDHVPSIDFFFFFEQEIKNCVSYNHRGNLDYLKLSSL